MERGAGHLARLTVGQLLGTPAARVTAGLVAALLLGGIALIAVNRAERLTKTDVAGVYRVEPAARGNRTDRILFQRLREDGRTWLEEVRLVDGPGGLTATVSIDSARVQQWTVDDGRLCIGVQSDRSCTAVVRDPVTGDLTMGKQRLTRVRSSTVVD